MVANFGYGALVIAFLVSMYGVFAAVYGARNKAPAWVEQRPQCHAADLPSADPLCP